MNQMNLEPATLAGMVKMIESKAISGKIGKQLLPELLQVGRFVLLPMHPYNLTGPPHGTVMGASPG